MNNNLIGVFDSGVGGLTVLKKLVELLPNENFIYFGDTKNVPYGVRTHEDIANLSVNAYKKLKEFSIKALVIACNTATIHGLDAIKEVADIPVVGVIEAGVNNVIDSKSKSVLVIATDATVNSRVHEKSIKKINPEIEVENIGCPDLVMAVENGNSENEEGKKVVERYLNQAENKNDAILLACTHFPALYNHIDNYYKERNRDVKILDPSEKCAEFLKKYLSENDEENEQKERGSIKFTCSGDPEKFKETANFLLRGVAKVDNVEVL